MLRNLHYIRGGNASIVKFLIKNVVGIQLMLAFNGTSCLQVAVFHGNPQIVEAIIFPDTADIPENLRIEIAKKTFRLFTHRSHEMETPEEICEKFQDLQIRPIFQHFAETIAMLNLGNSEDIKLDDEGTDEEDEESASESSEICSENEGIDTKNEMNTILKENSYLREKLQELEKKFEEAISKKDNEISAIKEKIQRQEEQFTKISMEFAQIREEFKEKEKELIRKEKSFEYRMTLEKMGTQNILRFILLFRHNEDLAI